MASRYSVAIIICSYTEKRWDDLVAAIDSALCQEPPIKEVIVVIDHNPALLEKTRCRFPDAIVIENNERTGLSGGRNTGIRAAKADLIAFLDDDAVAKPEWANALERCFDDPLVLGVGGRVIPNWFGPVVTWIPEEFFWVLGCSYKGLPKTLKVIRNPLGGNMMIRREVFAEVGGFRTDIGRVGTIPLGCEETELSIRASQHLPQGYFLYQPDAVIYHHVWKERATWRYLWHRCYAEGLSKALVSELVGMQDSLSTETRYVLKVLPAGILRGLRDAIVARDLSGLGRVCAIVTGLTMTSLGFLIGKIRPETRRLAESGRRNLTRLVISENESYGE